ncbi:MAG: TetR/AcrR family transcriptional regulator [Phycisphaerales bacterium]
MSRLPAAERKEQLLDRAAELFAERGYARTTTSELAKAAGVTEPIIYRHFASKRGLFIALIERTGKETLEQWEKDLAGASDAGERLRRVIGDNPMVSLRGRAGYKVFLQAISEVDDPEIHKAIADHITKVHAFLVNEIKLAQAQHKVTTRFSAEVIAWLLINIGMGYGVMAAMAIPGHGRDAAGGHVQGVLERILVGKDTGPKQG